MLELLHDGADVNALDGLGRTPLHVAARAGGVGVVRALLAAGADHTPRCGLWCASALHEATSTGSLGAMIELINHGVDLNAGNWIGGTPLHCAVICDNIEAVDTLVGAGADITVADINGSTPLHAAVAYASVDLVRYILARTGPNIDAVNGAGFSPLLMAARRGYSDKSTADVVQALLDAGCTGINSRDPKSGRSPLEYAAVAGHVGTLTAMIEHGADVTAVETRTPGLSVLHYASLSGNPRAIDVLVEAGANPEATDHRGMNCLHTATICRSADVVRAILQHGVDVDSLTNKGMSPLFLASGGAGEDNSPAAGVVDLLLRWGADETAAPRGATALQCAGIGVDEEGALRDDVERVRVLLENAPRDRAWRRRGFFVMCRAYPGRVRMEREGGQAHGEVSPRSRSRARLAGTNQDDAVGAGIDDWDVVADRLLWLDDGVFRTIIEYL